MTTIVVYVTVYSPVDDWETSGLFTYDDTNPFAVTLAFERAGRTTVSYEFGRDLLEEGLNDSAGEGAVIVEPVPAFPIFIAVTVTGPNGYPTLFHVGRQKTVDFLSLVYELVPQGSEFGRLDVDAEFAVLLGGES